MTIVNERFQETKNNINLILEPNNQKTDDKKTLFVEKIKQIESGKRLPIPIECINLSKNKRLTATKENDPEFLQLVETIKEVGILQAPVVTIIDNEIIPLLGHRRIEAARFLNISPIVCEIKHFDEAKKNTLASIIENTARKNWDIVAISKSLSELNSDGYNIERLAELLSKDRKTIGRLLKVSNWGDEAHRLIINHPDKIKMKLVLNLASKQLTEFEILSSLKTAAGLINIDVEKKVKKHTLNEKKAFNFIQQKNLTSEQSDLIFEVLNHFGLIKKDF